MCSTTKFITDTCFSMTKENPSRHSLYIVLLLSNSIALSQICLWVKTKVSYFSFLFEAQVLLFFLLCTFCTGLIFGNGIFCKNFGIDFQNTGKITTSFIAKSIKLQLKVYQYFGTFLHPNYISRKFSVVNNNQSLWYKLHWAWR